MRGDVRNAGAVVGGEGGKGAELVEGVGADFLRGEVHGAPAKAAQVREAGVGTDADSAADAFGYGAVHDVRIAGVEAARDVRAGDDVQEILVLAQGVRAESFSQIRHEIDHGSHGVLFPRGCCGHHFPTLRGFHRDGPHDKDLLGVPP